MRVPVGTALRLQCLDEHPAGPLARELVQCQPHLPRFLSNPFLSYLHHRVASPSPRVSARGSRSVTRKDTPPFSSLHPHLSVIPPGDTGVTVNIVAAMGDPALFGPSFQPPEPWPA